MHAYRVWIGSWANMGTFQERLKALREARNITQVRLAALLDIDPRVYNRWERGAAMPQFDTVIKIADILQVSLDELAGRKEPSQELKIHNPELFDLYQQVDTLSDEEQKALTMVLDSFITKASVSRAIKRSGKRR